MLWFASRVVSSGAESRLRTGWNLWVKLRSHCAFDWPRVNVKGGREVGWLLWWSMGAARGFYSATSAQESPRGNGQ